jgi:hypothetical protein
MKNVLSHAPISGQPSLNAFPADRGFSPSGRLFAGAVLGVMLYLSTSIAGAAVVGFGSLTDPAGDATGADVTSASISIDSSGSITFTAAFAPNSYDFFSDGVFFNLDLDSNGVTGGPAITGPGSGFEAFLAVAQLGQFNGLLGIWNGTNYPGGPVNFSVTPTADGLTATLPLSMFGTSTSTMRFSVATLGSDGELFVLQDSTILGVVQAQGGPVNNAPDSGSSLVLLSASALSLMAGGFLRRHRNLRAIVHRFDGMIGVRKSDLLKTHGPARSGREFQS